MFLDRVKLGSSDQQLEVHSFLHIFMFAYILNLMFCYSLGFLKVGNSAFTMRCMILGLAVPSSDQC